MSDYHKILNDTLAMTLDNFGIEMLHVDEQVILTTNAGTTDEHIELVASLVAMQGRLLKIALMLHSGIDAEKGHKDDLMRIKQFYDRVLYTMDKVYEKHAEVILNNQMGVYSIEEDQ